MSTHNWDAPRRTPRRRPGPGWARLRTAVLERDGHRCVIVSGDPEARCAETTNLAVDHIDPQAAGGCDHPQNLRTVCGWHHARITAAFSAKRKTRYTKKRAEEKHPGTTDR